MDIVTKPEAGQQIATDRHGSVHQVIEGVNHMGFLERPDIYNRAISEFAQSVQLSSGAWPPELAADEMMDR